VRAFSISLSLSLSLLFQVSPSGYLSHNRKQKRVGYNLFGAPLVLDLLLTGYKQGKTIFNKIKKVDTI